MFLPCRRLLRSCRWRGAKESAVPVPERELRVEGRQGSKWRGRSAVRWMGVASSSRGPGGGGRSRRSFAELCPPHLTVLGFTSSSATRRCLWLEPVAAVPVPSLRIAASARQTGCIYRGAACSARTSFSSGLFLCSGVWLGRSVGRSGSRLEFPRGPRGTCAIKRA